MIALFVVLVLVLLLVSGLVWAGGGWTVYPLQGSGIIEAIPGALEADPSPPVGTLVIASYSLAYGLGPQRYDGLPPDAALVYDRLDQMVETLAASGADIAFLQEVDFASQRTHDSDQLYYIAAALGWGYAARAITWECRYLPLPCWPRGYPTGRLRAGMGVISRYPLVQNVRQRLPQARAYPLLSSWFAPHYMVQMVDVQCGATTLRLLNVHLDRRDAATRQRQARALVAFVRDVRTPTSVLMGAFNTAIDAGDMAHDQTMPIILAELGGHFRLVAETGEVSTANAPHDGVNHALVGPGLHPRDTRIIDVGEPVSDHLPLTLHLGWTLPLMAANGRNDGSPLLP